MADSVNKCDWCKEPNKKDATYYKEMHKKTQKGLISKSIKWYSCDEHKDQLDRSLPTSLHKELIKI